MGKHEMWAGVFLKRWRIKGCLWKARENVTQVTFTTVKKSTTGLGAHWAMMAARDEWGRERERGIMDTGDGGGRVRRARVEECRWESYPCVTLKPNTYLLSSKMAMSAWPPLIGKVGRTIQTYSGPLRVTPGWCWSTLLTQQFISALTP